MPFDVGSKKTILRLQITDLIAESSDFIFEQITLIRERLA